MQLTIENVKHSVNCVKWSVKCVSKLKASHLGNFLSVNSKKTNRTLQEIIFSSFLLCKLIKHKSYLISLSEITYRAPGDNSQLCKLILMFRLF